DKATALRFVIHIVPDLHMPLHAGKPGDRGANDFKVKWFDAPQNLHWVWDVGMIEKQALSFSEYAERLEGRMQPEQVVEWWEPRPAIWLDESIALRNRIYPTASAEFGNGTMEAPFKLQYLYTYDWNAAMEQRLQQAGIRMAAYLDWVFAEAR
ncbi:MAG: S1/P1 Nuclease, partial [Proteobacteria bacterium]